MSIIDYDYELHVAFCSSVVLREPASIAPEILFDMQEIARRWDWTNLPTF